MQQLEMTKIHQHFRNNALTDVSGSVNEELQRLRTLVSPGARIAIATGSRGIANLPLVVKCVVDFVKRCGGFPFIVPAMGSHGGATAQGQSAILSSYGITEASVGAPIKASMDVIELPQGACVNRVFMGRQAAESDGIFLINRIKPHTDFHGPYESGLMKMLVIGLGKHQGALAIHAHGVVGLREYIAPTARQILKTAKVLAGIALIENASENTMLVKALRGYEISEQEPELLKIASAEMPKLPVEDMDVLIIDKMGKELSGTGIDSNIIGRIRIAGEIEPATPRIKAIIVRDLSEASHGNAIGLGLADVITRRLYDRIDFTQTYENGYTSGFYERVKIPVIAEHDRAALRYALRACGTLTPGQERIVRIKDTLHLAELLVSPALVHELSGRTDITVAGTSLADLSETNELPDW
jgi:hypothetical protein